MVYGATMFPQTPEDSLPYAPGVPGSPVTPPPLTPPYPYTQNSPPMSISSSYDYTPNFPIESLSSIRANSISSNGEPRFICKSSHESTMML